MLCVRFFCFLSLLVYFNPSYAETIISNLEIRGIFLGKGVECPQFMIDSGQQVSLIGNSLDQLKTGNTFRLTGRIARVSKCMQGQTFIVSTVTVEDAETGK